MWVCLNWAFFSTVHHRDKEDVLIVRARREKDILRLQRDYLPTSNPWTDHSADYPYRLECTSEAWASACALFALEVEAPNFKDSVKDEILKKAYTRVWSVLLNVLQPSNISYYRRSEVDDLLDSFHWEMDNRSQS